jgi:hypothetical protein
MGEIEDGSIYISSLWLHVPKPCMNLSYFFVRVYLDLLAFLFRYPSYQVEPHGDPFLIQKPETGASF